MNQPSLNLSSLYNRLFTFGSFSRVLVQYIISYLIFSVILMFFAGFNAPLAIYLIPLGYLLIDVIVMSIFFKDRDYKIFDLRRSLGKYLFIIPISTIFAIAVMVVSSVINFQINYLVPIYVFHGSTVFIDTIVSIPMLRSGFVKSIVITSLKIVFMLFIFNILDALRQTYLSIMILTIISASLPSLVYAAIYLRGRKILKASPFELLRGYIDTWLLDNPSSLEKELSSKSLNYKSKTYLLIFPEFLTNPVAIIVPYIHFGPFKNVGSSDFPYVAAKFFYLNKSVNAAVLHAPSTHEHDLPSKADVYNYLNYLSTFEDPYVCNKISNIVSLEKEGAIAHGIRICDYVLIFLEYKEMEDIPPHVIRHIDEYAKERGFKSAIVVDCHNSLSKKDYILPDVAVELLIELGMDVVDKLRREDLHLFRVGFSKVFPPGVSKYDGLGSNGITVIYFETFTASNALIIIDSNNIFPSLKDRIMNLVLDSGVDRSIIMSTDTHEVAALEVIEGGYKILGEEGIDLDSFIEYIRMALNEARSSLVKSDIHVYEKDVSVKILGYNLLDKLSKFSMWASILFSRWFLLGYLFTLFMAVILSHIIYVSIPM